MLEGTFTYSVSTRKHKHTHTLTHTQTVQVSSPLPIIYHHFIARAPGAQSYYRYSSSGNCESHLLHQKLQRTLNLLSNSCELLSFIHTPPIYPSIHSPLRHSPFISHGSFKHPSKGKIFDCLWVCRQINSKEPWYDTLLTVVTVHGLFISL